MTRDVLRDLRSPFYMVEHELLNRGLSVNAIAVYNVLRRHSNSQRQCFPAIRTIAKTLGIGKSSVGRALEELKSVAVIRVTQRLDVRGDRASNLYDLLPLGEGGCPATGTRVPLQVHGVPLQVHGVPLQTHGCPATGTELYPIELKPLKKSVSSEADPMWGRFCEGFRSRNPHTPKRSTAQKKAWLELMSMHPSELIAAKIDAWWTYRCPRLDDNRSVGAFLQWFDDIPVFGSRPRYSGPLVTDWRSEMLSGTLLGQQKLQELLDDVTEPDARVRTLIQGGYAHDEPDAERIISVCNSALA